MDGICMNIYDLFFNDDCGEEGCLSFVMRLLE